MSGCPCPLEVEASDSAVDIEDFAAEVEVFASFGCHGFDDDFVEWDAARGGFGVSETSAARDGECVLADGIEQGAAVVFGEV